MSKVWPQARGQPCDRSLTNGDCIIITGAFGDWVDLGAAHGCTMCILQLAMERSYSGETPMHVWR